jgi:fructose-1,6-bisphosphatase II / sedoheptulose-1,7-bisphosphatase
MDKIAVGGGLPEGVVDLDRPPEDNIRALAKAKGRDPSEIMACILDRPRHAKLIEGVRKAGARIKLIPDGDVAGVIWTTDPSAGIDVYMGIGGAPEGVLAAAALASIGGQMQGRLVYRNEDEKSRARKSGVTELDRKYTLADLAHGDVLFAATGVTQGSLLDGVRWTGNTVTTHTMVMRAKTGTIRWIKAQHDAERALKGTIKR